MPTPRMTREMMMTAVRAWQAAQGNVEHASRAAGMARGTMQHRLRCAKAAGLLDLPDLPINAPVSGASEASITVDSLRSRVRALESELRARQAETLDAEYVKSKIIGLSEAAPESPQWLLRPTSAFNGPGVPTLFLSDLHWGEVVDPRQIGGVNEYSLEIAHERLRAAVEVSIDLLFNHLKMPEYPGIVLALGGDMVSGDIHEELSVTNEREIMPTVLDLWGALVWVIETLADTFGRVFVPCVTGNHGRNTQKIRAKGRAYTSFDWLLYQFLSKRFESDARVQFMVPDGPDALYSIYGHRYLLTHGDQFRGGDGLIGALGPIIRGDHKKRSRNGQLEMGYETLMLGHWHQLIQMQRLIVNGSCKGYDEYANQNNFPYEPPRQALWITHWERGISFSAPVHVDRRKMTLSSTKADWLSWRN